MLTGSQRPSPICVAEVGTGEAFRGSTGLLLRTWCILRRPPWPQTRNVDQGQELAKSLTRGSFPEAIKHNWPSDTVQGNAPMRSLHSASSTTPLTRAGSPAECPLGEKFWSRCYHGGMGLLPKRPIMPVIRARIQALALRLGHACCPVRPVRSPIAAGRARMRSGSVGERGLIEPGGDSRSFTR